jgi:hypothetical protein
VRVWTYSLPGQTIEGTLVSAEAGAVRLVPKSEQPLIGGSRGEALAIYGLGSAALGAGIGALIKTDRWTPVALDTLGPPAREARSPLSLKLTFRF